MHRMLSVILHYGKVVVFKDEYGRWNLYKLDTHATVLFILIIGGGDGGSGGANGA